jgi:glycine dehydrogenase subunit 2
VLAPYLPIPVVEKRPDESFTLAYDRPDSIGKMRTFVGNFGVLVRAYAYIRALGPDGLRRVSEMAVLNANYLMEGIKDLYDVPFERRCMHEFVASATPFKQHGVRALDIAKRMLDYGFHPPTTYFPLIVDEALMFEPTETESREDLDRLITALRAIAGEATREPETLHRAPITMPVRRLDEAQAARQPVLRQRFEDEVPGTGATCAATVPGRGATVSERASS